MTRILIVDDEIQIRRALDINLRAHGYEVDLAETGEEALTEAAARPPDLVLLDLGLPGMDGVDVIRGLRVWTSIPIIILSARHTDASKVAALDAGADDYITKPFSINELLARVRASLRRHSPVPEEPVVETADFAVDMVNHRVTRADELVHLTPTEWADRRATRASSRPARHAASVAARRVGSEYENETNYLRVHLAAIRRKLEPDPGSATVLHHRARHRVPLRTVLTRS